MSFSKLKTINDLPADEVISALQKEIRRCNFEAASFFAIELLESGENFEKKFWERMMVISVEDVSDLSVIPVIRSLKDNYSELKDAKVCDRHMQAIKAVKVLCDAKKDRIVSEIYDYISIKRKEGHKLTIPDYAIDMHTKRGKEKGLGYSHFINVSSKVNNEVKNKNKKYLNFLKENCKD